MIKRIILVALMVFSVMPVAVNAVVHNLDSGFNYSTIQAAIDNANTLDGHTLSVDPGIYTENVVVNKSLIIKSASGNPSNTIVNASSSSSNVILITVDNVSISGFTIKDASASNKAGIYINNAHYCNISDNKLFHNVYGIYLSNAENNTLTNNIANNNTFGVELYYSLRNNLTNITANSNSMYGFDMYASYNNRFVDVRADYNNKGFYFSFASYNWVDNSSFRNNSEADMGLYTSDGWWCPNYLSNVTGSGGRAIGYYYSPSNISNMNFSELILCNADNSTITNVRVETYDTIKNNGVLGLLVDNSCFINLSSNYNDRGMKFQYSHYNNFSGIKIEYSKWDGVRFDDSSHNLIEDSFFNNTELNDGLALYTSHNNKVSGVVADSNTGGYGVYLQDSRDNSFSSLVLSRNHQGFQLGVNSSHNNFTDVVAEGNTLFGGYISSVSSSSDSNIMDNVSARSNGWYGLYLDGVSSNIIRNSSIENNTLYGIYLSDASNNNITNCTIINSSAWDFYSAFNSTNNTVKNTRISQTKISFTGLDIALKQTLNPPADPNGAANIGKYLNITNNSAGSWISLNISYLPSDLGGMNESKLKLFRYHGATWQMVPGSAVNTVDDFVHANITSFSTFAPMVVKAESLRVHNLDSGFNYSTIQAAIDNANTLDGHTLSVDPGIYTENVVVNKSLIIKSASGNPSNTIVNASSSSSNVILITVDNVSISGFTIKDASASNKAGIYINNAHYCNISDNKLSNNGDGIYLNYSSDNTLRNITTDNNSVGIYLRSSFNNTLQRITADNSQEGIYIRNSPNNTLQDITTNNNWWGIDLDSSSGNILQDIITGYDDYEGIYLRNSSDNTLRNITAKHNNEYGIHIRYDSDYNNISDSLIENNTLAGIYLEESLSGDPEYNTIYNNILNNTVNVDIDSGATGNRWNTTKTIGINIVGGQYLGGNYWTNPTGTGWSDICNNTNGDGICDEVYDLGDGNIDYLPLTTNGTVCILGINLSVGWNAVSLIRNKSYTAESLLDEIDSQGGSCSEIDRWYSGGWSAHIHNIPVNDFSITEGEGYYVKCSSSSTWNQAALNFNNPVAVDLFVGWNALSVPYSTTSYTAESLLDEIDSQGGSCSEIDRWYSGGWSAHIHNIPVNDFSITEGEGYYIKCSSSSVWTPT